MFKKVFDLRFIFLSKDAFLDRKFGDKFDDLIGIGVLIREDRAAGRINIGDTDLSFLDVQAKKVSRFNGVLVQECAGADDPCDFPSDNALCEGRVFHLLADGYFFVSLDQFGDVSVSGVIRNAAHGDFGAVFAAGGQYQIQDL